MASIKKNGGVSGGGGTGVGGSVLTPTRRNSQVRSPCIKRLPTAPVALQGWLHKQGSDGLMLWKKRWFVLSDYCLFYYKGQEEEKLLGSILLPSYRIAPCSSEDKVYRKFSFKAEHANMRTYYFAADNQQQMAQWMNALSLASILQDSGICWDEHRSALNSNRNNNNNNNTTNGCDDSDSGFQSNQRLQPHQNYNDMPGNVCDQQANVNSWQNCQLPPGYQPLYANAPPKPRRLNDSSSTERSPERLHDDTGGRTSRMGAQPQQDYNHRNYSTNVQHYNAQHSHHRTVNNLYVINNNINSSCNSTSNIVSTAQLNNSERRTPDTYGRSNNATPCAQQAVIRVNRTKQRNPDYEDVYQNNPDLVANTTNQNHHRCSNTIPYAAVNHQVHYRRKQGYHNVVDSVDVSSERQKRFQVRPHSADFLEYDAARYYSPTPQSSDSSNVYDGRPMPQSHGRVGGGSVGGRSQHIQKPRPKSSMEIAHPSDSQHWSEEGYARKMRQSASFVAPQIQVPNPSSRATTPSLKQTFPGTNFAIPYEPAYGKQMVVPPGGSAVMRNHCEVIERQERKWNEYVENRGTVPFVRSASARLARQLPDDQLFPSEAGYSQPMDSSVQLAFKRRNSSEPRESGTKIQQREESMKRLLEWKQRMLQSPLTRKNSGSSSGGRTHQELKHYKQQLAHNLSASPLADGTNAQTMDWLSIGDQPVQQRAVSTMPEMRSSRRKEEQALHQAPRSATTRSRSQDGRRSASLASRYTSYSSDDEASGSGSVIGRDPLPPRTIIDKQPHATANGVTMPLPVNSSQSQRAISPHHPPLYTPPPGPIMRQPEPDLSHKRIDGPCSWNLQMSAGELLGRTHEELVLLLIQLRRQSAGFCKAMEGCHIEIEAQARLAELETPKRMEHLQKLEDLKRHLLELEKQYEKGKPLVNLVDNMVKLGSLYRAGTTSNGMSSPSTVNLNSPLFRERLEFNHKVQEQRLLAEERKDWDRLSPDHNQLQAKVAQLYRLDKLLQEESGTLHSLQQDKEMLEQALGGLRHKLQVIDNNPVEAERYRKQQRLLERELTRVRSILAHNSKKLEETVAENARLEQELVVLRQKVQTSRRIPDPATGPTTAALEAELRRVQTLVGDLQRQRHELSVQVRQLTDKSRTLSQQIRPGPTGVAGPILGKKRSASSWLETDLDSQVTRDLGLDSPTPTGLHTPTSLASPVPPLYVNTDDSSAASPTNISSTNSELASRDDMAPMPSNPAMSSHQMQYCRPMDISEADDRIKRFYGIIPKDKPQEIKTVRIVKRESERRQRDRDRSGNIGIPLTNNIANKRLPLLDEYSTSYTSEQQQQLPTSSSSSSVSSSVTSVLSKVMEEHDSEPPSSSGPVPPPAPGPRTDSVNAIRNLVNRQQLQLAKSKYEQTLAMSGSSSSSSSNQLSATEQLFGPASPQLSPVYQSEAARQIIEEMSATKSVNSNKRLVPREKRRHHTVSGRPLFRIDTSYAAGGSRDDLDMERALRPRLNAPDVVRSTLSRVDTKFSSETIDNLLGTPEKILIPERYVPETSPELSIEEQAKRSKKAEAIRKMLSETTGTGTIMSQEASLPNEAENNFEEEKSSTLKKKVQEEKRQREHLLQLNQILAQQVMEKSKIVAGSSPNISSPASFSPGSGYD